MYDMVAIALSGVQRFISESRSTADLRAGSLLMSQLAAATVTAVGTFGPGADVIIPGPGSGRGTPNRVVARTGAGHGRDLAEHMEAEARQAWREHERKLWAKPRNGAEDVGSSHRAESVPSTAGFPVIQWVVVGPDPAGYAEQWGRAMSALAARKRIRSFEVPPVSQSRMCSLTGRWPALGSPPAGARNVRRDEALSVPGHVKRRLSRDARQGFSSTWSIATAPYRAGIIDVAVGDTELLAAARDLRSNIREFLASLSQQDQDRLGRPPAGSADDDQVLAWLKTMEGAWLAPETWEPAGLRLRYDLDALPDETDCFVIRDAVMKLARQAGERGVPSLTPYLAVVAQDADHMGEQLGEFPPGIDPVGWHQDVSAAIGEAARRQREEVEAPGRHGRVVYAGGDDLLALAPVATATSCVRAANSAFMQVLAETLPAATASAAIVFFHAAWPLQSAITAAQELLKQAKAAGRPGLGIAVLRRGGERNRLVVPWDDPADPAISMISHVETLAAAMSGAGVGLSGRLASELERDRDALATLPPVWLGRELSRRSARHGGEQAGPALLALSYEDASGRRAVPDDAVTVARFLAAEGAVPEAAGITASGAEGDVA